MITHPTKANAPGQGGVEATNQSVQPLQYSPKSTAAEAQRERILHALRIAPRTSYDLRRLGCYQAPARIIELRRRGFDIRTELVDLYDIDGYLHPRCARYHLHEEVA
jgi:hypothetical protein